MKNADGTPKTHKIRLLVEVNGIYADDILMIAEQWGDDTTAYDVLEEELRMDCTITVVNLPGDGNLSDDFGITCHQGLIVGAEVVPIDERGPRG